jgi:ubiquinone biosynthesis protein
MYSLIRLVIIYLTLVRHGLDEVLRETRLWALFRIILFLTPSYWINHNKYNKLRGERLREALEELGPIFVKLGQILSTRRDLLPDDLADELAKLQDRVTPIPQELSHTVLENAYGKPPEQVFAYFEKNPLAAASIAQVHAARLNDGREVVVKIIRPGIAKRIQQDIKVMYLFAHLAEKYWSEGKRLHPVEVIKEFEHHLNDELDLLREAGNCTMLRRNFDDSHLLYVPEVIWEYSNPQVFVMERVFGIPISHLAILKANQVNLRYLAEAGVEIFFTQVFRDNFFHADMHPGNIFVDISNPEYPNYIAVDFGIMGTLSKADQHYLAENFLAFFRRDYRRVAELHVDSGWVPPNTRIEEFEGAIRSVCEPIFNRPLKEISFGLLLLRLFQTARRFNMEVQPQLVLLQKTLLNIEGLGRQLYPDLDLWQTAQPYLEKWMKQRVGVGAIWHNLREEVPHWIETIPELPRLLHHALLETRRPPADNRQHVELQQLLKNYYRRNILAITGGSFLISAAVLIGLNTKILINLSFLSVISAIIGLVLLIFALAE